jgi:hypothetical protein
LRVAVLVTLDRLLVAIGARLDSWMYAQGQFEPVVKAEQPHLQLAAMSIVCMAV